MLISYNWLKQFIHLPWEPGKTGELLTDLGLEVEGVTEFSTIKGGLKGVVVGDVVECEKHPNADRLKLTKVNLGDNSVVQIVCGAPNVEKGQKVAVATVRTTLYDKEGNPFIINKGKIRGEISEGMICSEIELGLGTAQDGILVLDPKLEPGTPVAEVFEVETDFVYEIGLTPNRSDAMSHWGVARDLKAGLIQQGISTKLVTPSTSSFRVDKRTLKVNIEVEDNALAPRYCGITISGIKVAPSPFWLQNRLKSIGLSPVNNVVDATNYVLHELGQPLHAFDADKIHGKQIRVKRLGEGTKFVTLDGVERTLSAEDLMICDAEKPLCIAGVFGGLNSGVTEETTKIFLESAYFDPVSVRKTAKRHGLSTDASFRFERGVDPNITDYALRRAVILILELAGGEITSDLTDLYPKKIEDHQVFLHFAKMDQLIGEKIPVDTVKKILTSLDMKVNNHTETGIGLSIPAYRNDVIRDVDIIEEILRVYGYNNINFSEKLNASTATVKPGEDYDVQNKTAALLTAQGFDEMMNNSLTTPKYSEWTNAIKPQFNVPILSPLSQDLSVMRQSMLFSGLEVIEYNSNRRNPNLALFEFGKTYHNFPGGKEEKKHLSVFLTGTRNEGNWILENKKTDFFYGKGIVVSILERLGLLNYSEEAIETDLYSEAVGFVRNKTTLVEFGIIRKNLTKHFDIQNDVFYADFNWDQILKQISTKNFAIQPIPKFPESERDFALLIDSSVSFKELRSAALEVEKKLLKSVSLFDVYTGKNLPEGKKSYALNFIFRDENQTLTDKKIDKVMSKLREKFESSFGATLR